ncbi:interferon-induced protein 44-like [Halichoeres trimaculatus]|uniref:interferon-induced protein 44-like n=1 Tax=Halichoeres trimaculatus TaxID=147232 RepID=UPI003D9F80B7
MNISKIIPSAAFSEPWRQIPWGNNAETLQYVQEFQPGNEDLQHIRILLYGPIGAGKSSFINSVSSVMRRRMATPAIAASVVHAGHSFTKKFETHKIKKGRGGQKTHYPFVFNDIMGLEDGEGQGVRADDIKVALKGHMREGYMFNPVTPLTPESSGYNPSPSLDNKVHVLVCVLSANVAEVKESVIKKMADIREVASLLGIPQMAIISCIDQACEETEKDLKNVYKSKHLKKKMEEFSAAVGIPLNYIFPVKNYSEEIDLNDDVDALILSALKKMIDFGDDFTDK